MKLFKTLDETSIRELEDKVGSPLYLYDESALRASTEEVLAFPNAYGLTARFAVKACPNATILRFFDQWGLHFDASSIHEVERITAAGIHPSKISLSSQELSPHFAQWVEKGISINACSLDQIRRFGEKFPGQTIGLRFNPGLGSGSTGKTNVGGPSSSFGIWHEAVDEVKNLLDYYKLTAFRIHSHIGSGSDPEVWKKVASLTLNLAAQFPDVTTVNLGGGYKVARVDGEKTTDLQEVGAPVKTALEDFARQQGRKIHLEIEPGTYLVARAGYLLSRIQDKTNTGSEGFEFLKLNAGMTDILRPSLYAAQHPMKIFPEREGAEKRSYVVVGHCCESGDLLTPSPDDAEALHPRALDKASIGDWLLLGGAGAYCSSMSAKNYNSFPEAPEVLLREDNSWLLIRRRQPVEAIWSQETAEKL